LHAVYSNEAAVPKRKNINPKKAMIITSANTAGF
jgi:hypothetical protein